jgi:hypothetical protein
MNKYKKIDIVRLITGIIGGHLMGYAFIQCFDTSQIAFWLGVIINWGYLIYIYTRKQMSKKWIAINKWLIPTAVMSCAIHLPLFTILLLKGNMIILFIHYLYIHRLTLIGELAIAYFIFEKIDNHLFSLHRM